MPTQAIALPTKPNRLPRRRVGKVLRALLLVALSLYLAPLVFLSAVQDSLLFHPAHYASPAVLTSRLPAGMEPITFRTSDGDRVAGVFARALRPDGQPDPAPRRRPTLLYFHGNGGDLRDVVGDVDKLRRMDANVLASDYVGYGLSTAPPSERGCEASASAALIALRGRPEVDPARIVLLGHSLGTAVAIDLAAHEGRAHRPLAALALVSGFTSIPEQGHVQYPIYPTALMRLAVRDPFDSERKLSGVTCPVLIAHSRSDELIPFWMAARLASASRGPVTRLNFDHVAHGDAFTVGAPQVLPRLRAFLNRFAAPPVL